MTGPRISDINQIDDLALGQLKAWLEPWWINESTNAGIVPGALRAQYIGPYEATAKGVTNTLSWDGIHDGEDLFDISDPDNPVVLFAGFYAFTCVVQSQDALSAAGYGVAGRILFDVASGPGNAGNIGSIGYQLPPVNGVTYTAGASFLAFTYLDVGDDITLQGTNYDDGGSHNLRLDVVVNLLTFTR